MQAAAAPAILWAAEARICAPAIALQLVAVKVSCHNFLFASLSFSPNSSAEPKKNDETPIKLDKCGFVKKI